MAIDPRMAERIKKDAPRCKFIKNIITDEVFKNNLHEPNSGWMHLYEHAVKNPETFERSFVSERTGEVEERTIHAPAKLATMKMPVLRGIAQAMHIPGYIAMSKNELITQIIEAQLRADSAAPDEDADVSAALAGIEES